MNLFILGGLTGLVFSPTFPLSFGFINPRLNVNPFLVALFLSGSACGGMVFQKIGGKICPLILIEMFHLKTQVLFWIIIENISQRY